MIEVSLYAVAENSDVNVSLGKCIDRTRFEKESMNTSVMEFVKGFLRTNLKDIEPALKNSSVAEYINSDSVMTTKDFASINYWLAKVGFLVKIWNVTDDEENPTGVTGETAEWNVVDNNFLQYDYPTAIKVVPGSSMDVVSVLEEVTKQTEIFKVPGIKNPLDELMAALKTAKDQMGKIEPGIAGRIYDILGQVGIEIFLATGE